MVGDSLESDIKPSLALGMKTIWLNRNSDNINKEIIADIVISRISRIHKYI